MKKTIAIGLSLMLGLTAGISFADEMNILLPGPTEEFNNAQHIKIPTNVLDSNKYYNVICTVDNIHYDEQSTESVMMIDHMHSHGSYHNMGPVTVNGVQAVPRGDGFEGALSLPRDNTVVFQKVLIEDNSLGSHITVKAKNADPNGPHKIYGPYIKQCSYELVQADSDVVSIS